jgi:mannitol-1-phosphate 5-dehydrogenase
MIENKIVIWGAGRIGRGFIGDLFNAGGYQITYIDQSRKLVDALGVNKKYRIVRAISEDDIEEVDISNYSVFHTSQHKEIREVIDSADLMAIAVYPQNFEGVASQLQGYLLERNESSESPLDILLCTNLVHAGPKFSKNLFAGLSKNKQNVLERNIGIVETLIIRICPNPPDEVKKQYPLVVWTNGYPQLPVDLHGFKGKLPEIESLRFVDDMRAEEIRKMYTYNMSHAVLSFHGHIMGHELLVDCLADERIRKEAEGALGEVSQALQKKYKFSKDEMESWIIGVITQTNNPVIGDTVVRSAADPIRKLKHDDRLIGPALLCLENGIQPKYLIRAIGAAFHYYEEIDKTSKTLYETVQAKGIRQAIIEICNLTAEESDLVDQIVAEYQNYSDKIEWIKKAQEAYRLGFEYEKKYHGCGQCAIAAASEVLGNFDDEVFNSATGLCGGLGLVTENTCSALTGGAMVIGTVYPRRREHFDGDRDNKYLNFELVRNLRDKFIQEYGTTVCRTIHEKIYGRTYDMRLAEERQAFEEAGGHGDNGCTEVVAKASQWTIDVIKDELDKREE